MLVFYLCKDDFSAAEVMLVERESCVLRKRLRTESIVALSHRQIEGIEKRHVSQHYCSPIRLISRLQGCALLLHIGGFQNVRSLHIHIVEAESETDKPFFKC